MSRTGAAGPIFFINRLVFYKERFSMPPPHPHQPTHPPTHPWIHSSPMDSLAPKDKDKEDPRTDGLMHPIGPYVYCLLKERRRGKDKCEGVVGPLVARLSPTRYYLEPAPPARFFFNRLFFYKEGFSKPPPHPHPPTHPHTHPRIHSPPKTRTRKIQGPMALCTR